MPETKSQLGRRDHDAQAMGLKGIWAQIANVAAVTLLCVMFYQDRHQGQDQAREDRALFRQTIKDQRDDSDRQWQALREDSARQWQAIRQLTSAIKHLTEPPREPDKP